MNQRDRALPAKLLIFALIFLLTTPTMRAQQQALPHAVDENDATSIPGVRMKTQLLLQDDKTPADFDLPAAFSATERPLYQQINPCQLIDTRNSSTLPAAYAGPRLSINEMRGYQVTGTLSTTAAEHPCSERSIPVQR